ncbi:hypothetical protein Y032_0030g2182 [Ancylostoma ceylanicum]|nr:hypothetical protein Y032_0030g2182 [Ancylostoma ceylanicum]
MGGAGGLCDWLIGQGGHSQSSAAPPFPVNIQHVKDYRENLDLLLQHEGYLALITCHEITQVSCKGVPI